MSKRQTKRKRTVELFQVNLGPALVERFRATPEFKLYGKKGTALLAILDRVLPLIKKGHDKVA